MSIATAAVEAFTKNEWRQFHSNVWMARRDEAGQNLDRARAELRRSKNLEVQPYKAQYELAQAAMVNALNAELASTRGQLSNLLRDSLQFPAGIDIVNLRAAAPQRTAPPEDLLDGIDPPQWADFMPTWMPERFLRIPMMRRLQEMVDNPWDRYEKALNQWQLAEDERKRRLREAQVEIDAAYAEEAARVDRENLVLDEYRRELAKGDRDVVVEYFEAALNSLLWPKGFPRRYTVDYQQSKTKLDVTFALPTIEIVPTVRSYALNENKTRMVPTVVPEEERQELYHSVMTQATLRIIRELFGANAFQLVSTIDLLGKAEGYDDATGQPIEPHLARITVDVRDFDPIRLEQARPEACLRALTKTG